MKLIFLVQYSVELKMFPESGLGREGMQQLEETDRERQQVWSSCRCGRKCFRVSFIWQLHL